MKPKFDSYTFEARLLPVFIVGLPVGFAVIAFSPLKFLGWGILTGFIASSGISVLLAQMGRDMGKNKEIHLFESWGGMPTTLTLRYRSSTLNQITLKRYHEKLANLVTGTHAPTADEEVKELSNTDQIYKAWVDYLRTKTRDRTKFQLVFEENKSYGFRRNLWGMKPLGLMITITALVAMIGLVVFQWHIYDLIRPITTVVLLIIGCFLFSWIFWFNPAWVRVTADAYAKQLVESCDQL